MNKKNIKCSDCTEENPCPKMTITTSLPEPEKPSFSYKLLDIEVPKDFGGRGKSKSQKIGHVTMGPGGMHFPLRNIKKMLEIEDMHGIMPGMEDLSVLERSIIHSMNQEDKPKD